MPTVLITGASGFIGSSLARHYKSLGWRVAGLDRHAPATADALTFDVWHEVDLVSPELPRLIARLAPLACVHAAGAASVADSMKNPEADFQANVAGTTALLAGIRRAASRCHVLFLSSAAVYGEPTRLPIPEEAPPSPLSPYGRHKRLAEVACQEHVTVHGGACTIARIFSAYGPGLERQVVFDMIRQIEATGQLLSRGSGEESRDFLFIDDLVAILADVLKNAPGRGEVVNVASGTETRISQLAALVVTATGKLAKPVFEGTTLPGDPLRWRADVALLGKLTTRQLTPLAEGLKRTVTWYRSRALRSHETAS